MDLQHPLDAVARAGADGLSRRQMLKASMYGAAGLSVGGTLVAAQKAWAGPAFDCQVFAIDTVAQTATLSPSRDLGRGWPTPEDVLARLNRGDALRLAAYAAQNGYRPAGVPGIRFVKTDGRPSAVGVVQELATREGFRGRCT